VSVRQELEGNNSITAIENTQMGWHCLEALRGDMYNECPFVPGLASGSCESNAKCDSGFIATCC